ncbi:hypothetical protein [Streptomyces sp. MZ04]|uniref:hypothetical protein n=1 Tax=Streptomyces sp. MZ04 TaxID=2559236 RepID=UPI00107E838D|nr:hypothetical protein [Streptomyces sp. MZ04]TGB08800.1 hypothetical protein E2651_17940 [Streptomyces sp. MZ04]
MGFKRRAASLLTVGATLGISLMGFSATSANAAAPCGFPEVVANNSSASFYFNKNTTLRRDPYADCDSKGVFAKGQRFFVWCYVNNFNGNTWYYGRINGTQTKGWVSSNSVTGYEGSSKKCPQG